MSDLEEQLKQALEDHAHRTGGLMVGDRIAFGTRAVEITGCTEDGRLTLRQVDVCHDPWSWFGSSYRECALPHGHTGPHEQGGIRWGR